MTALAQATNRFPVLVGYTLRACMPRKRLGVLALPCAAMVLFGLLTHAIDESSAVALQGVVAVGVLGLALPLANLVIGDAVLGAEVRSGTMPFTWLTPARFGEIVVARWLGAWLISLVTVVPAAALAALVAGVGGAVVPIVLAVAAGAAGHLAIFVMIGCLTRRAAVWSLAIVFLGERLLGAVLTGVAQLSPTWLSQQLFATYAPGGDDFVRSGVPDGLEAVIRVGIITTVCLFIATWGLGRLQFTGARD